MSSPRSNVTSTPSISTRINEYMSQIPIMTRYLIIFMTAIYVGGLLFGNNYATVCFFPYFIINNWEIYRMFTSVVFHGGILHILFNMMAYKPMGCQLETLIGSVAYLYLIFLFTVVSGLLNLFISLVSLYIFSYPNFYIQCGIGFSGIIFGLIVIQTYLSNAETQSIFGFFNVPSQFYPWALLIIFQIIMPGVSFIGHLSGMLVGYMYCFGFLNYLLLSPQSIHYLESTTFCCGWMYHYQGFIANPLASSSSVAYQAVDRGGPSSSSASSYFTSFFSRSNSDSNANSNNADAGSGSGNVTGTFQGTGRTLGGGGGSGGGGRAPSSIV
eukprot:c28649_g1_i1.p1 GENE.c28649_g1_i1~~c28649_g1_i1.p1  ORF type:complete len:327 (-),score=-20.42 c28649_g1_i1:20-1000(-)